MSNHTPEAIAAYPAGLAIGNTYSHRNAFVRGRLSKLPDSETLARLFHENYEQLAPTFNYSTRIESAVPWEDVPASNKALMVTTADAVLTSLAMPPQAAPTAPTAPNNHGAEATPTTDEIRTGYGESFLGDGSHGDLDEERAQNILDFARWLAAHDADIVASTKAQQYAVTRDAIRWILHTGGVDADDNQDADLLADALLAPTGPLLDAADVWNECCTALSWALGNGNEEDVASYVAANNPYRKASA